MAVGEPLRQQLQPPPPQQQEQLPPPPLPPPPPPPPPPALQQSAVRAQDASIRSAQHQQQQQRRVRAPDIANTGLEPLPGKQVLYVPVEASKVRSTCTLLSHPPRYSCSTTLAPPCESIGRCPTLERR